MQISLLNDGAVNSTGGYDINIPGVDPIAGQELENDGDLIFGGYDDSESTTLDFFDSVQDAVTWINSVLDNEPYAPCVEKVKGAMEALDAWVKKEKLDDGMHVHLNCRMHIQPATYDTPDFSTAVKEDSLAITMVIDYIYCTGHNMPMGIRGRVMNKPDDIPETEYTTPWATVSLLKHN